MRVSYIIHYKHNPENLLNLKKLLEWLTAFNNIDIIVVEQDKHSNISHLPLLNARHLFIKNTNNKIYNKSWAYNYAIKRQNNPICVFSDCDIVMDPVEFSNSLMEMKDYDVIKPYNNLINLTQFEMGNSNLKLIDRKDEIPTLCSKLTIFKTESIIRLGGWNELFETLGNEDVFQEHKIKLLGMSSKINISNAYHFYHEKPTVDEFIKNKSDMYLNQLLSMDLNKIINHVNVVLPKIGMANKYY